MDGFAEFKVYDHADGRRVAIRAGEIARVEEVGPRVSLDGKQFQTCIHLIVCDGEGVYKPYNLGRVDFDEVMKTIAKSDDESEPDKAFGFRVKIVADPLLEKCV
jgi:uncharacterized OB-fold protein